uniref:Uncharacterized protein n=1 Tax=Timema tahoe TaxID=61484 RepID=A0A7R9ILR4_9NEOP|nr:unnamed protein product [Timema tahoe]
MTGASLVGRLGKSRQEYIVTLNDVAIRPFYVTIENELWGDPHRISADLMALGVYMEELTAKVDAWDHYIMSPQHQVSAAVSPSPLRNPVHTII